MDKNSSSVGTGLVGAPACGDVMKLQIQVDPATNTISDVKFKTFGCGSAIASSSYLTELVRGMTLEDAGKVRNTEIARVCSASSQIGSRLLTADDGIGIVFAACQVYVSLLSLSTLCTLEVMCLCGNRG